MRSQIIFIFFFFQAEDGIRDKLVLEFRRVLFRSAGLHTGDILIELLSDSGGRIYRNPHQPVDQRPDNDRSPLLVDLSLDLAVYAVDPEGNAVLTQTALGVQGSGVVIADDGVLDIEAAIAIDLSLLGLATTTTNLALELITDPHAAL